MYSSGHFNFQILGAFKKEEGDRLIKIITSRVTRPRDTTLATGSPELCSAAVMESKKWMLEKKSGLDSNSDLGYGSPSLNLIALPQMLAENMQELTSSVPTNDANFDSVIPLADQSNPVANQAKSMDKRSGRSDDDPEPCLQMLAENMQESTSSVPTNDANFDSVIPQLCTCTHSFVPTTLQKESKGKRLRQGKSLAGFGTSWESGVRRSTRYKTTPLAYWKGERLVYGRVHESLSTVIGVKRTSPGTDGKPELKAKSFVSDQYKELFEIASQH